MRGVSPTKVLKNPLFHRSLSVGGRHFLKCHQFKGEHAMLDFFLKIISSVLHMNLRDHHDIPFALPLVSAAVLGFVIGFIFLKFIGEEQQQDAE
ncbi:MAG: hypothetical protein ACKN9F_11730 [Methylomonas sp.]